MMEFSISVFCMGLWSLLTGLQRFALDTPVYPSGRTQCLLCFQVDCFFSERPLIFDDVPIARYPLQGLDFCRRDVEGVEVT